MLVVVVKGRFRVMPDLSFGSVLMFDCVGLPIGRYR